MEVLASRSFDLWQVTYTLSSAIFCFRFAWSWEFLIAILHRDLRNDFFFVRSHTFFIFYLDFYFSFSIWTLISPFLFRLLFPFSIRTFIYFLESYLFFGRLFPFFESRYNFGFLPIFFMKCVCDFEKRLSCVNIEHWTAL